MYNYRRKELNARLPHHSDTTFYGSQDFSPDPIFTGEGFGIFMGTRLLESAY